MAYKLVCSFQCVQCSLWFESLWVYVVNALKLWSKIQRGTVVLKAFTDAKHTENTTYQQ